MRTVYYGFKDEAREVFFKTNFCYYEYSVVKQTLCNSVHFKNMEGLQNIMLPIKDGLT